MSSSNHIGSDANNTNNTNGAFSSTKIHNDSSVAGPGIGLDTPHGHSFQFPVAPYQQALFSELPPYGHTFPQPFHPLPSSTHQGIPLTPNSSESRIPTFIASKYQTESNPSFPSMGPSRSMSNTLDTASEPEGATIDVATEFAPSPGPTSMTQTPPQSSRRNKNYTLADGTIVSGKGLGRGRPGVKRGPRNSKYHMVEDASQQEEPSPHIEASVAADGALPIKKRRLGSSASKLNTNVSSSSSPSLDSRESSIEYNPTATHTRSGRQTQKPLNLATDKVSASPASKPVSSNSPANVTPSSAIKSHPKIKRRVYRGREQFALCEHCLRGHGPSGNVIVFCDACNKCWHQRCHEPQISAQTVSDSKAEWFCSNCDHILHGKKGKARAKGSLASVKPAPPIPQAPTLVYAGPRVGGRLLNSDQKLAYLNTLSKEQLISLLMDGAQLAPDLPIFETLVPLHPQGGISGGQFTSTYVTPVSNGPQMGDADGISGNEGMDEGYDGYYDEHAALYPKPGFGVQLPPEREDLHMMLEGKEIKTFSHWVRGMRGNMFGGTGNVPRA